MPRYYRAKQWLNEVRPWPLKTAWCPPFPVEAGVSPPNFKMPLPQSDAEFAILTEIFFGKPLTLSRFWLRDGYGQAQIAEKYDSFGDPSCYSKLDWFMRTVFGPMHTSSSLTYTDFKRYKHRHWRRLERWQESRRRRDSSSVRPAFVRLAHQFGVGENIVRRVDRRSDGVLMDGREDAASAA